MDMLEAQINSALTEGMPEESSSRPGTPGGSTYTGSPRTHVIRGLRPSTRESTNSTLSRYTTESKAISVLGAARGPIPMRRKATADALSVTEAEQDRMMLEKSDGIAARIAAIQHKVRFWAGASELIAPARAGSESCGAFASWKYLDSGPRGRRGPGRRERRRRANRLGRRSDHWPSVSDPPGRVGRWNDSRDARCLEKGYSRTGFSYVRAGEFHRDFIHTEPLKRFASRHSQGTTDPSR